MAKKQTRRSISVSKTTYERLKTYCEAHGISMSQVIERQIGDLLGSSQTLPDPMPPRTEPARTDSVPPEPARTDSVPAEPARREPRAPNARAKKLEPDQIFTF